MCEFRCFFGRVFVSAGLLLELSCVSTEETELPSHVNISPEEPRVGESSEVPPAVHLGCSVERNESDTLEKLEVLPGVRVSRVDNGGPAALAGLKTGDVILLANGVATNDRDALEAVARRTGEGKTLKLEVRRDTVVFETELLLTPLPRGATPVELYRVDPVKTRAGYRTVTFGAAGETRVAAEVVRIFPRSHLPDSGVRVGDRIIALEKQQISSAQHLVRSLLSEHDFGDVVGVTLLRDGDQTEVDLELWEPGRRIAAIELPILFSYESNLRPSRTRFELLDLFIISLFGYCQEEGETEISFLSLFRFRSGYGELIEEGVE